MDRVHHKEVCLGKTDMTRPETKSMPEEGLSAHQSRSSCSKAEWLPGRCFVVPSFCIRWVVTLEEAWDLLPVASPFIARLHSRSWPQLLFLGPTSKLQHTWPTVTTSQEAKQEMPGTRAHS
jgi:hypothetical protein